MIRSYPTTRRRPPIKRLVFFITIVLLGCHYPTTYETVNEDETAEELPETITTRPVDEEPVIDEPVAIEEPYERSIPVLKPIPSYPAYLFDCNNVLWGIPASAQGPTNKVPITIETVEGEIIPRSDIDFYTEGGAIYITHGYTEIVDDEELSYIDTYIQVGDTIELCETPADKKYAKRVTLDSPAWLIESVVLNGVEYSHLYNRGKVFDEYAKNPKGFGPFQRSIISNYVILDHGIAIMSERGLEFMPSNRIGLDVMGETGRLWK